MDPLTYADYYVGNLSVNTGLNLLTNLYSTTVAYSVYAQILAGIGEIFKLGLSSIVPALSSGFNLGNVAGIGISALIPLAHLYNILAGLYLDIFAPLVTLAVGFLFIQFILIPLIKYVAFTILLPVAIGMRSLSFMGNSLKSASNSVLAFAIAIYIIYPLMLAFNGYAIGWIFSTANPSFVYLHSTYIVPNIPVSQFFKASLSSSSAISSLFLNKQTSLIYTSVNSTGIFLKPRFYNCKCPA
jgi:hypothetical protein